MHHIDKIREEVLPPVKEFTKLISEYTKDNKDMRECVRKYDESLCLKVNKSGLIEFEQKIRQEYLSLI